MSPSAGACVQVCSSTARSHEPVRRPGQRQKCCARRGSTSLKCSSVRHEPAHAKRSLSGTHRLVVTAGHGFLSACQHRVAHCKKARGHCYERPRVPKNAEGTVQAATENYGTNTSSAAAIGQQHMRGCWCTLIVYCRLGTRGSL